MQVLIDGSNMWARSYTGAMHLTPPGGPVTIMSFMLRKLCRKYGRKNIILCWDGGQSGRKEIDPNYKAGRPIIEGMWDHVKQMKCMVSALGFESAWQTGYEADDVIATLAKKHSDKTYIISTDKDFYQLVDDKITVVRPERKYRERIYPEKEIREEEVIEEFGVGPNKVALLKAFKGDTSDNIPKLPIRFAKKFKEAFFNIIERSETVEEIYEKLSWFSKKQQDALIEFKEQAIKNYKLVLMKTHLEPVFYTRWLADNESLDINRPGYIWFDELCQQMQINKLRYEDFE